MAYLSTQHLAARGFGRIGANVKISDRAAIYEPEKMELGDNVRIDDFCVISGKVRLGRNSHVTVFCNLAGGAAGIEADDFVTFAYGCNVFSTTDDYSGETLVNSTIPREFKNEKHAAVRIGRQCIFGTRTTIMPGVTVGDGVSTGAHTLLLRDAEPWSIYIGAPARFLRRRSMALLEMEQAFLSDRI